ncbi:MAG TPA: hypothetical protein VGE21_17105 [Flavobacteriales bacterium]
MEPTPSNEPRKNRSNSVLLILVVLLLISNVVLLWLWSQKKDQVVATTEQLTAVSSEKDNVTNLLEDMLQRYDTLSTNNQQLTTEMEAQKAEIETLLKKVKDGSYSLSKAKKEAETLRKIMQGYVVTIDSLNQVNQQLMAENTTTKQQLGEVTGQKQALEARTAEQDALIAKGSVLTATSISGGALFLRNNGKQVDTERASKAEMIKSCFTLGENRVAQPGNKTLYMRIIGPDGSVLPSGESNNRFRYDGVEGEFSAKREVNYQGQPVDVCMFWNASGKLNGGQYIVQVYENGGKTGETKFDLK